MKAALFAIAAFVVCTSAYGEDDKSSASAASDYPKKNSSEAAIHRGSIVFRHYCELCHGAKADGSGRAAKLYNPKPANLVTSDKNDAYKEMIIRRGGQFMGRSEFMPPWGNELTDEQVTDVVAFLRSIRSPKVDVK